MATYNTAMGVMPSPKTQLFGGNAGNAAMEAPKAPRGDSALFTGSRPAAQQAAPAPAPAAPAPTFAQMQQQGQARPAPQTFDFTPNIAQAPEGSVLGRQFQQGRASQDLLGQLMNRLSSMQAAPSVYDDPALVQRRQAAMANLQAERQASEAGLTEEMARRGLAASSIAAGRMGDIAGQFARAQATMEADLLKESMAQEQQRQQFLTQQLGATLGTVGGQELQAFQANVESSKAERDIALRTAELQMQAAAQGATLNLTQARDLATQEYQKGQLQQAAAEMASRERMSANELAMRQALQQQQQEFQRGESALERNLREAMQTRELTSAEQRQLAQFDFQRGESALERGLRETLQTRELSAAEKRQLAEIDANKAQQERQFGFQRSESSLERGLREAMQTRELSAAEKRQLMEIEANKAQQERQFGFQAGQSELERNLREKMQTTELSAAEKRQLMEIEANKAQQERQFGFQRGESALERELRTNLQREGQTFQAEQNQIERNLREKMQTTELSAAEKRQLAEIEANKAQQERQFGFQRGESALDRALRERFGMAEATGIMYGPDGKPVLDASGKPVQTLAGQQFGLSQRQFEAAQKAQENQFMIQLAAALAPMDQAKRDEFLRNNPTIRNLLGMQSFGPVAGGTGAGIPRGTGGSGGGFGMDTGI